MQKILNYIIWSALIDDQMKISVLKLIHLLVEKRFKVEDIHISVFEDSVFITIDPLYFLCERVDGEDYYIFDPHNTKQIITLDDIQEVICQRLRK